MLRAIALAPVPFVLLLHRPQASANGEEEQIARGESLVKSRCVFCRTEKSLPALVKQCSDRRGSQCLEKFPTQHYAPDDEGRAAIIAFLTCEPARQ